ncbi:hypothetical protein ABK046_52275, partial [Streptomyces caeruleatus]
MMHNGILDVKIKQKNRSDTWHFSQLLKKAARLNNVDYKTIEKFHGNYNKMIFMYPDEIQRT